MAPSTLVLPFVFAAVNSAVRAEDIAFCGTQPYYPSQYTCFNGFLCPVVDGERTLKCDHACFLPEQYDCNNGTLSMHKHVNGPYTLFIIESDDASLTGLPVTACGNGFFVGTNASSCTYCPSEAPCSSFTKNAGVVMAGSSLWVEVPGGQQAYIDTNKTNGYGLVGYTQAHSIAEPMGADAGLGVDSMDLFVFTGRSALTQPTSWLACPSSKASTASSIFQVAARLEGFNYSPGCRDVNISAQSWPSGRFGAWQYT